jgi:hypothetical protein
MVERASVAVVPSPRGVGRDLGAADPAVDAEELDSVGFSARRPFSGWCEPQLEAGEELAVAERGGGGNGVRPSVSTSLLVSCPTAERGR